MAPTDTQSTRRRWLLGALAVIVVVAAIGIGLRLTVFAGKTTQPAAQGLLYSTDNTSVSAIHASDGTTAWRVGGPYSVVFAGQGAVLAAQSMHLTLLDGQTGQIRWTYALPTTTRIFVNQAIFDATTVYVAWQSGTPGNFAATMVALRLSDGHVIWQTSTAVYRFKMMLVNDLLVVGEQNIVPNQLRMLTLTAFAATDGTVRWRYTHTSEDIRPVAAQGTTLIVDDGAVVALQLTSGTPLWRSAQAAFTACVQTDMVYAALYHLASSSNPATVTAIVAYHLSDGLQLWQHTLPPLQLSGLPTCAGMTIIVEQFDTGTKQTTLYGLDAATGAIRWQHPPAPLSFADARVGNGTALLTNEIADSATMKFAISLFDIATGSSHWQTQVPGPTSPYAFIEELPYEGTVFVTIGNDPTFVTYALDAATGAIRWHQSLGNLTTPDGMGEL